MVLLHVLGIEVGTGKETTKELEPEHRTAPKMMLEALDEPRGSCGGDGNRHSNTYRHDNRSADVGTGA